ncbi:aminotransferase class V-fold PLP-dependent enzyme [Saccharopolyspora gloriosae]|uniref:aminotransferase class V-fold PLP-dependent enzyme n=1 Tax=Saccharopolyspora gloriosae TaxID=455344 RepID=UPI001FB6C7AD|nr:aminotransferase class V-fold PLP-dependent enzyme [Saccharopolyspora gloriosae]
MAALPAIGAVSACSASPGHEDGPIRPPAGVSPEALAGDEEFWRRVAQRYTVSDEFINLENGYYGIMPDTVRRAFHDNVDRLNAQNSHLLRNAFKPESEKIRERIAALLGAQTEEIALTQSGTEALQNLIAGYHELRPGDAVMYADLDYPDMIDTMDWLRDRRGVDVVSIALPEPATRQAVLDTYAAAFRDHPSVKLLLLSHVNNRTGLATPVREITAMARSHGIDVIVDAAHSWGQLDFTISDLDADFAGFSLHKWIGAPLGTGFLYIRRSRLDAIDPAFADESYPVTDIRSRVVSGTRDVACVLSVPTALDFHQSLGSSIKQARLRYLRDRWVSAVADRTDIEVLTPQEPSMYGAITSFRITGRTTETDNEAIADYLLQEHGIFTVAREGPLRGSCVRVTPALFTTREHVDRLAVALRDAADRFRA